MNAIIKYHVNYTLLLLITLPLITVKVENIENIKIVNLKRLTVQETQRLVAGWFIVTSLDPTHLAMSSLPST